MSPRFLRIDAIVFQGDSVRFEACPSFRAAADSEVCECGWLEGEHGSDAVSRRQFAGRQFAGRRPRRRPAVAVRESA